MPQLLATFYKYYNTSVISYEGSMQTTEKLGFFIREDVRP